MILIATDKILISILSFSKKFLLYFDHLCWHSVNLVLCHTIFELQLCTQKNPNEVTLFISEEYPLYPFCSLSSHGGVGACLLKLLIKQKSSLRKIQ